MKLILPLMAAATVLLVEAQSAYAGFFGTFCVEEPCQIPEPSSLSLLAIGGAAVAVGSYLKSRKGDK